MRLVNLLARPLRAWIAAAPPASARELALRVREDLWTHGGEFWSPGFQAPLAMRPISRARTWV